VKSENIGKNKSLNVGSDFSEKVGKNKSTEVSKDLKETVGGQHKESVTKEYILNAKKIQLVGQDEITIKTGSAEIVMKKNGDITIKGKKINVNGSGDVIIKGSKILGN
jgi:type VI secretion system secreted protein VgrG